MEESRKTEEMEEKEGLSLKGSYGGNCSDFEPEEFVSSEEEDEEGEESSPPPSSSSEEEEDLDFEEEEFEAFPDFSAKFREILDQRVAEVEGFYDRGILRPLRQQDEATQTDFAGDDGIQSAATLRVFDRKSMETQTDDGAIGALQRSREEEACARREIAKLREAKEPLAAEIRKFTEKLKDLKAGPQASSYLLSNADERRMFEMQEAIEAIDLAIEFKNEIIAGHEVGGLELDEGEQDKADLVNRLASLSVFDLQRLFAKYFVKAVEYRHSTKKLEKKLDRMEVEGDKMRRRIRFDSKALREKDLDHEDRIKYLLTQSALNQDARDHILWLNEKLTKGQRRQLDFQRSLTELLVRHGYLLNGADYDVRQVVRMLGLDAGELAHLHETGLGGYDNFRGGKRRMLQRRNAEVECPSPFPFSAIGGNRGRLGGGGKHHRYPPSQAQGQGYEGSGSSRHHSSHHGYSPSHGQASSSGLSGQERQGGAHFSGTKSRSRSRGRRTRDHHNNHHPNPQEEVVVHQNGTEVKRVKNKLIIQPNSSH